MVDRKLQIDNPSNKALHYGDVYTVGIINPPDKLPKVRLYSEKEAMQVYDSMQYDLYISQQKAKPPKSKRKFPLILKITGGTIGLAGAVIFRKDILKFFKGLFRKKPKI